MTAPITTIDSRNREPVTGSRTLRLGIVGIQGRMGREIARIAASEPDVTIAGGTIRPGSDAGMPDTMSLEELLSRIDALIDFSTPEASVEAARQAAASGVPLVIGTTGLSEAQLETIRSGATRIPICYARNMSHGIGVLQRLLPEIARALAGYDIEIVEAHHRHKADAPSGTALALAEAILAGIANDGTDHPLVHGRQGASPRQVGEIGMHAIRGGGNTGEHEIIFADEQEEIRISHRAYNRSAFAAGAIRSAHRLAGMPPGWYTPADL